MAKFVNNVEQENKQKTYKQKRNYKFEYDKKNTVSLNLLNSLRKSDKKQASQFIIFFQNSIECLKFNDT